MREGGANLTFGGNSEKYEKRKGKKNEKRKNGRMHDRRRTVGAIREEGEEKDRSEMKVEIREDTIYEGGGMQ